MRILLAVALLALTAVVPAASGAESAPGKSHALILAGLPGDAEHEELFASVTRKWRTWLTESLGFAQGDVHVLFGQAGKDGLARGPASREAIEREVRDLRKALRRQDRLWVFLLGHGDYDGEHASFHLPGPDLREDQLGKLFAGIDCREQVFWLTTSASGWFLKSLSAPGRIVITATAADEENNETELPEALATVCRRAPGELDSNKDGKVSLLELFRHAVAEVEARFKSDDRAPTEHAQLDDNGDGTGTEEPVAPGEKGKPTADGALAARTYLPLQAQAKTATSPGTRP